MKDAHHKVIASIGILSFEFEVGDITRLFELVNIIWRAKQAPYKCVHQSRVQYAWPISESAVAFSMYGWHTQLHPPIQTFR